MRCPTCNKPAEWQDNPNRPFCSERCKLIDFGRWANEEYRVPVVEPAQSAEKEEISSGSDEE
ncbi:MAG: DNA gyrase inhibitor YacG [Acidobacteria bacterium]|nr:MAG: DNA gyrase inhibitor YacG [Acidobacteriota bacterium]